MPVDTSKKLVVDASVARASGNEGAVYPTSKKCRDLLIKVLEFQHRIVMTPEIGEEWRRYQSNFARKWRVSMEAKKKVYRINVLPIDALRGKLLLHAETASKQESVRKDFILIEAALATDLTIISLDDAIRNILITISTHIGLIRDIAWVNPDKDEETPFEWIKNGALPEIQRKIGYQAIR